MRIVSRGMFAGLALLIAAPLVVAQSPAPEPQGPGDGPQWREEMRPRMGHGAGFMRMDGMDSEGMMRRHFGLSGLVNNPQIRERLGITSEQAAKIRSEELEFRKTQIRDRADLEIKHLELGELIEAEKPDRTVIDKKLREISEVQFASEKSTINHHLNMKEALTPEQREKMKQMMSEMHGRQEGWNFRHPGPGGPGEMERHGPRGPHKPALPAEAQPRKPAAPGQPEN